MAQLTMAALAAQLPYMIKAKRRIMLVGAPGVGKTDVILQSATAAGADCIISHPVVADPTDYKGIPWVEAGNGKVVYFPPDELQRIMNADRLTVFFLDDLGQALPAVQAAAMQLVLSGKLNGISVSPHVVFMAATNRREDKAAVHGVITPLRSRFHSVIQVEPDEMQWITWGIEHGIRMDLISHVMFNHGNGDWKVCRVEPSADMSNSTCPRTLANMIALMDTLALLRSSSIHVNHLGPH